MNDVMIDNARQIICYDLFKFYTELDPYTWEQDFFTGSIETYEQLKRGEWRDLIDALRDDLTELEDDTDLYRQLLEIIESIEEIETEAEALSNKERS